MNNKSIEEDTYKCIQVFDVENRLDDLPSAGAHFPGHYNLDHWDFREGTCWKSLSERPI